MRERFCPTLSYLTVRIFNGKTVIVISYLRRLVVIIVALLNRGDMRRSRLPPLRTDARRGAKNQQY